MITIQANNVAEVMAQIALSRPRSDITIDWVKTDYGHRHSREAIVTVGDHDKYPVPIHCKTSREIIALVGKVAKEHDAYITQRDAKQKKMDKATKQKK